MSIGPTGKRPSLIAGTARGSGPQSNKAKGCMIMETPTPMITSTTIELSGLGSTVRR